MFLCRQLRILVSFVLVLSVVSSTCLDELQMFVVVVDDLFSTFHAAVTDFDCVTIINNFSKFAVFWEVLDY